MPTKKRMKKPRATQSFEQMVSQAQLNALKPYIEEQVRENTARMIPMLTKMLADPLSMVQNRLLSLEEVMGVDKEALAHNLAKREDAALGLTEVEGPAKEGDSVRLEVVTDGGDPDRILIQRLMHRNAQGQVQTTFEELEKAVIGLKVEESSSVKDDEGKTVAFRVIMLSRKVEEE